MANDDWQKPKIVGGDGTNTAHAEIELATGVESKPCVMCRSFENTDKRRLIEHILSKGLKPNEQGNFETPIAKDFVGRKSLQIDPKTCGYCRADGIVVDMMATCEKWKPTRTLADFQRRMK